MFDSYFTIRLVLSLISLPSAFFGRIFSLVFLSCFVADLAKGSDSLRIDPNQAPHLTSTKRVGEPDYIDH